MEILGVVGKGRRKRMSERWSDGVARILYSAKAAAGLRAVPIYSPNAVLTNVPLCLLNLK